MEQISNFILNSGKTAKEQTQCLKLFLEMKLDLICMFWNGLKIQKAAQEPWIQYKDRTAIKCSKYTNSCKS